MENQSDLRTSSGQTTFRSRSISGRIVGAKNKYSLLERQSAFFTGSKPLAFVYNGEEYEVDSWHNLVLQVCLAVYQQHLQAFVACAKNCRASRVSCIESDNMTKIGDGVYVRCGGSAWDKCQTIRCVLQQCHAGDVQICFNEEIEEDD